MFKINAIAINKDIKNVVKDKRFNSGSNKRGLLAFDTIPMFLNNGIKANTYKN